MYIEFIYYLQEETFTFLDTHTYTTMLKFEIISMCIRMWLPQCHNIIDVMLYIYFDSFMVRMYTLAHPFAENW